MKRTKSNIIQLFLVLSIFLISCKSFGDPIISAKGTVKDTSGTPIEGVTVVIEKTGSMPRKEITKSDGAFDVMLIGAEADKTKISFTKAGYKTVEKKFESEGTKQFDVTLEAESK